MRRSIIHLFTALSLFALLSTPPALARGLDEPNDTGQTENSNNGDKEKNDTKKNPIKKLVEVKLDPFLVPARTINIPLPGGKIRTVRDLLERFKKWGEDDEIGAVLLNLDGLMLQMPDVEELMDGIKELRANDKKIVSFLNAGDPMSYLLACQTDEIAMAPIGGLSIPGLGRLFPYMRGMYQMLGIEYDVITAGEFKYPGFLNRREPDKYFLTEYNAILDSLYGDYIDFIADGRGLDRDKVLELVDIAVFRAEEAHNRDLVDVIAYYDDYKDRVIRRNKYEKTRDEGAPRIVSINDLLNAWAKEVRKAEERYKEVGPKIAILHARGPIVDMNLGPSFANQLIMRDQFCETIEQVRRNKTIQGVVLRIDSPGGSAYASDIIWKKLKKLDEEKPIVISMGTVAGSGGYYIACPGRLIFAQPTTITGSIGVLGILANQASMFNRMDVNLAEMQRGKRALLGSAHEGLEPDDRKFIQELILDTYDIFLSRVAESRKMPVNQVRKIAGGRVYTGRQAIDIGLVDRLGGLKEAIDAVRDIANIPPSAELKLVHYPRPATIGELFESFSSFGLTMQAVQQASIALPQLTFDHQVRLFTQRIQPLCWMAMPDEVLNPVALPTAPSPADLLGLPQTPAPAMP